MAWNSLWFTLLLHKDHVPACHIRSERPQELYRRTSIHQSAAHIVRRKGAGWRGTPYGSRYYSTRTTFQLVISDRKGPKNFTAERVFISPQRISFGVKEPDGVELLMVHATTPQGPRSSLSYQIGKAPRTLPPNEYSSVRSAYRSA